MNAPAMRSESSTANRAGEVGAGELEVDAGVGCAARGEAEPELLRFGRLRVDRESLALAEAVRRTPTPDDDHHARGTVIGYAELGNAETTICTSIRSAWQSAPAVRMNHQTSRLVDNQ